MFPPAGGCYGIPVVHNKQPFDTDDADDADLRGSEQICLWSDPR
jgi:hypothetical protein